MRIAIKCQVQDTDLIISTHWAQYKHLLNIYKPSVVVMAIEQALYLLSLSLKCETVAGI